MVRLGDVLVSGRKGANVVVGNLRNLNWVESNYNWMRPENGLATLLGVT
jgi:hypothetical protein